MDEMVIVAPTGLGRFQVEARIGGSALLVDEPAALGGLGSGPNPYDLMCAALGACTSMTLKLYAERKGWTIDRIEVGVVHGRADLRGPDTFARSILVEGPLDAEQTARLLEIADRCPVHLTLERGSAITTTLVPASAIPPAEAGGTPEHMRDMAEATAG
jgi:putative redox protein